MGAKKHVTELIVPDGLGFGEGNISKQKQLDNGETTHEMYEVAHDIIASGECMEPIPTKVDDDGCGDGRPTAQIYQLTPDNEIREFQRSLLRPKLFGAGAIMMREMVRAVHGVVAAGDSAIADLKHGLAILRQENRERNLQGLKHIKTGAHTGAHMHGDNCDCGAIAKSAQIIANGRKYNDQIDVYARALLGNHYDEAIASEVAQINEERNAEYMGAETSMDVIDEIKQEGAIIKHLEGDHKEDFVVINHQRGFTFNQAKFTQLLRERMVDAEIHNGRFSADDLEAIQAYADSIDMQVFSVDAWRMEDYAHVVADHMTRNDAKDRGNIRERQTTPAYIEAFKKALYAGMRYTLATAATLTDGTLPVYLHHLAPETAE